MPKAKLHTISISVTDTAARRKVPVVIAKDVPTAAVRIFRAHSVVALTVEEQA
jgi:hypothetical protein